VHLQCRVELFVSAYNHNIIRKISIDMHSDEPIALTDRLFRSRTDYTNLQSSTCTSSRIIFPIEDHMGVQDLHVKVSHWQR
jgi:hypothetical protein